MQRASPLTIKVLFRGVDDAEMSQWADRGILHAEAGLDWKDAYVSPSFPRPPGVTVLRVDPDGDVSVGCAWMGPGWLFQLSQNQVSLIKQYRLGCEFRGREPLPCHRVRLHVSHHCIRHPQTGSTLASLRLRAQDMRRERYCWRQSLICQGGAHMINGVVPA